MRDPSSAQAKVYNNNVECVPASVVLTLGAPCLTCSPLPPLARLATCLPRSWTQAGGGFELWKEAFDGPALPMILSAVAGNGTQMLSTVTFDLDMVTGGSSLLNHEGNGYDTYNENLYYLGTLPIGTANETDGTWQIATAYDPGAPISFKSYSCESFTVTELCSAIPPPPPPRAPPAPRVKATAYVYYQGNVTATAPRDVVALGPGARRHLLQGGPMCTVYYRQVNFLTMLTIAASPPVSCGGGYCENTTWSFAEAPSCGAVYTPVTVPIDASTYEADVADGFAWCSDWPSMFTPVHAGVSLRSIDDPYLTGGALTNCSYVLKAAGQAFGNAGFFFIIPGMAVSLVAFFCLEGMCTPRALSGVFGSPGGDDGAEQSRAPLSAYGQGPGYGGTNVELSRPGPGGLPKFA